MKMLESVVRSLLVVTTTALMIPGPTSAAPVVRAGAGMTPAEIQHLLDLFVIDLDANNYTTIDWDELPDEQASPNSFPGTHYVTTDPRGISFSTPGNAFAISADSDNPTATAPRFGDIDPSYESGFQSFSAERLFTPVGSTEVNVSFSDSSGQPATVTGFGAVFTSVDSVDSTYIEFFDPEHNSLTTVFAPAGPAGGLSFLGVSFDSGESVGSVTIRSGNTPLGSGVTDGGGVDVVAIDNLIFSTPVPEPSTFAFLSLGTLALFAIRRCHAGR